MWTLHQPNECEASKTGTHSLANANIPAFNIMDSESNRIALAMASSSAMETTYSSITQQRA